MIAIGQYTISTIFDGDSYVIQPSVSSVVIEDSGIYNPSEITFNNKHKQGTGELENYSGRIKIETTSDNTNWTTQYTSSSNEASKTYSLPSATVDKEPYNFRKSPVSSGSKTETIVGGSLVWNQLVDMTDIAKIYRTGCSISSSNGKIIQSGINSGAVARWGLNDGFPTPNKVVLVSGYMTPSGDCDLRLYKGSWTSTSVTANTKTWFEYIIKLSNTTKLTDIPFGVTYADGSGQTATWEECKIIDLTTLFGSTIADYIYSLEQSTAGAGVAWVKRYIDLDTYHEYDAGSIQSVEGLVSHDVVGFNQWDEEWELGGINTSTGAIGNDPSRCRSKNFIPCIPNMDYYFKSSLPIQPFYYDANKEYIEYYSGNAQNTVRTIPLNCCFMKIRIVGTSIPSNDITINISDPSRNGTYEPYEKHSYPLDSSVTLRGVPKLVTDHIEFDGDKYRSDGTLERRSWFLTVDGSENWSFYRSDGSTDLNSFVCKPFGTKTPKEAWSGATVNNAIASNGYPVSGNMVYAKTGLSFAIDSSGSLMICTDQATSVADFKTYLASNPITIVYLLATPTTETAQPFQSPMIVGATEEYVSDSVVPVGHESKYTSDIKNIRASLYKAGGTTALLNQITIPVLSQEDFKPKLINTIRQYTKSTSSTSLPSNPTWVDDEEPTIGDNEYMWARLKHVYSDGTFVYSNAVCSTSISGAIHDVDKANKSITDKVWESDITTKINQYDGSTVSTIRDRVSTTETDISGIKTRVSDVESETDDLGTRMATAETAIEQTANNVLIKATESDTTAAQGGQHLIQSLINVAPSGVTISADKVNIEGAAIFSSGRLSQTSLNNAYDSKGSAAAVQTNLDNLEIGGRNYYKNYSGTINYYNGGYATKDASINGVVGNTNTSNDLTVRLNNVITEKGYWTVSGYVKTENAATLSGDICDVSSPYSLATTSDYKFFTFTVNVTREITTTYHFVDINITKNAVNFWFKDIKVEKGNKPTSWTPAPEDQFASTVPCYYRKTTFGAPSAPSSTVGTSNNTDNTWTYVMPLPKKNCYFFICEEYTNVGGTKSYSTVRALDSQTYTSKWVSSSDQTYIDGGSIYTHSITTSQLATDAIKSTNYLAGGTNSPYSSAGTFLDLSNGNFYTPNFGVQSLTGKAYLNGEIIATSGSIGDDSGNYWEIGNTIDSQGNGSASIVGNGTAYIQDGDWQIHSGLSNYSNGSINTQWYTTPQGGGLQLTYPYYDGYYYDYGMTSPVLDTTSSRFYNQTVSQNFLYIRKHASTIPALESDWNYIFRVDKDGMVWINGQSITQMIQSGVDGGAYVPTSGGTITGNLTVTGTLTATASKANQLTHSISVNGKAFDGSADVTVGTIGAAYGGTGQTSLKAAGTAIIGALDTNTTTPVDNDYIATGSSTFYRKTMSKLWDYIKGKLSADHSSLDSVYVKKSGDTMTGSLTVEDSIYADSAQLGDLVVSGSGRFANGLYGNLTGNADTATMASGVADSGNGTKTTFAYSKSGLSTASWIAAWSGYELRAISPANLLTTIGAVAKSGDTMTGTLTAPEFNLSGGINDTTAGFRLTNNGTNMDMGWTWTGAQGAGACFTSSSHPNQAGIFDFFARAKNSSNQEVTKHLIGNISGVLTWDGRRVVTATNSTAIGGTSTPIYIDANGYAQACTSISATTATKFSSAKTIKLTGDVTGSASSDGSSDWSITTTVGNDSHQHTPSTIIPGDASSTGTLDPITQSMIGSASSNKSIGLPANAITVEYSTNGGSTWTDYGATDAQKRALFNETRGFSAYLGKATAKASNNINNQLRITIEPLDRYVSFNALYIWFSTQGNTCTVDLERSTIGAKETFASVFSGQPISGWSGNNIRYFNGGSFGGGTNQTTNNYKYRLTFKQTAINTDYPSAIVMDIRFLGVNVWNAGTAGTGVYNMLTTNRLYVWDADFNATFPAGVTATSFTGNASSASKLNSTRSFTIGNTAKNVDWSGAVSYSKAEISDEASSTTNGWMSVADKKKLDSITVSDIGTIGANSIRGEKDIKVTISSGIATIGHENSAITAGTISGTATSTLSNGGSFKIPSITYDAYGHITGTAQTTITLPNITSVSSATTATKFNTSRSISLSGDVSGTATADGSSGWSITTTVADDSHNHTTDTIVPKLTKSYTGIIGTSTSQADTDLFFLKVVPDSYGGQWFIRYKVLATMDGIATSNGLGRQASYVYMSGMRDTYSSYRIWNDITNTGYRPFYYHTLYRAREVGISYGHAVGVSLQYSYNPSTTTYKRNITVEIIDYGGCTLSFLDTPVTYSNWTGNGSTNYSGLSRFDGATQGNTMQGDRNEIYAMGLRNYNTVYFKGGCVAESLAVGDVNGYTQATSGTSFDMTYPILWVTSAKSAGATDYSNIYTQHYDRNIANLKSSFTSSANKVIYLVATVSGKTATIDSTVVTDTLPSTDDGKVYISIGRMGNNSTGQNYFFFWQNKQMYWYKDGAVRPYVQRAETSNTATTAETATSATTANFGRQLLAYGSNETTIGANSTTAGNSTNETVWFNYRDIQGGSTTNNSTQIVHYYFGNRKGATTGVNVHAATFVGDLSGNATTATSATKATADASGNTITSYYCTLSTNQTISGTKTFSAMPLSSAGICVNSGGSGTAGGVSLWSDKNVDQYGLALRTTANSGKHGFVQGDYATYSYMYAASDNASLTRGWVFKNNKVSTCVASINAEGKAVFNGSVTVGGNATNTSGCRQEFDSTLNCLNFIFN